MTMLQQQAIQIIDDIPDDRLQTLIDLMKMIATNPASEKEHSMRIGLAKDMDLYNPDYDLDEYNPEIARLFGAVS